MKTFQIKKTDICSDGDTGEYQFLIYLGTKDEKIANERIDFIVAEWNRASKAGFFDPKKKRKVK